MQSKFVIFCGFLSLIISLSFYLYQIDTIFGICGTIFGVILILTGLFEFRKYQNKLIYLVLTVAILIIMLILVYIQISLHTYKGNIIDAYTTTGMFMLFSIWIVYIFIRRTKRYQKTAKSYDNILKINPYDSKAWNNKGTALANVEDYREAMKCFDKSIEMDPNNAAGWHNKGVILEKLGKHQEAIKYYDKALQLDPQFEIAKKTGRIILEN